VEQNIVRISDDEALLDGRVSIDDLNELFETQVKNDDYDTVGGCVFHHLGHVPNVGDAVETEGVKMTVLSVDGHRVKRLRALRLPPPLPEEEAHNGNGSSASGHSNGGNGNGK
jgi:CBS domain containing-hemolysin-like protein